MILVLPDLEILQGQDLLRNLFQKPVKEILSIKAAIQDSNRNPSKEAAKAPEEMKIRVLKLKAEPISRIPAKDVKEKLSANRDQKEVERVLIPETSMKEAA